MTTPPDSNATQRISRVLVGSPLETQALAHQTVSKPVGLAVFASDALSSTAYATEEILLILTLAGGGAAVLGLSIPIAFAIAVLIGIVTVSYRQTIFAYPNGGGAYVVARDNLGELPAQIAGAALLTDYILTVAVSVSSGTAQIASAFPALNPFRVDIALGVIIVMTIINLRGVRESGAIFAVPTYFFLGMMFLTLIVGAVRWLNGSLPTVTGLIATEEVVAPLTLFLILRAFSSGSAALTGIEAISNGITAFKEPRSRNAATTLIWMSGILIVIFLGITLLAHEMGAIPSETETIISQMARTIYPQGSIMYLLVLAGTALILLMAANTSYADFPRLAALSAADGFLPRILSQRGSRLVFSWGIILLATFASLLIVLFQARTSALIPLYAVGVFLSFTLSQSGMAVHLWRVGKIPPGETVQGHETELSYDRFWRVKMVLSMFGALCTGIVMLIFVVTKFTSGAWFVTILIPILVIIFFRIHRHYRAVAFNLRTGISLENVPARPVRTIILVADVHAETIRLVNFARSLGQDWEAVHVAVNPDRIERIQKRWQEYIGEGTLTIIPSPYRHLVAPIRAYIQEQLEMYPDAFIHIIMGHLAMDNFVMQSLHRNSAFIFNVGLNGLERLAVTRIPYQIHELEQERP